MLLALGMCALAPAQDTAPNSKALAGASTSTTEAANVAPAASRARLVPVLISVTGAGGSPIAGLTKEQITLIDTNQIVQPLQILKASDIPLHLGIVLVSEPASFSQQQAAATSLLQRVIRPNVDEAFVATARGKKPWPYDRLQWKQDPAELSKMIQGLNRDAGLPDAFNFDLQSSRYLGGWQDTVQVSGAGGVNVFDAVYAMMNSEPPLSRRVLVIFREPWPHSPGLERRANDAVEGQLTRVIAQAQELRITTFVIGLEDTTLNGSADVTIGQRYASRHVGMDEMDYERLRAYNAGKTNLERLAAETGGSIFWSTKKNYSDAVKAIANQLDGQYIVTFVPGEASGPAHSLKVTSSNGAHVLAPKVFFYTAAK
jgi:VWFA-related protein